MEENNEPQFNQSSQPPVTRSTYDPNEGRNRKIIILLVLVFVILAILAVGGVLLYKIKKNQPIKQSQASVDKAVFDKAILMKMKKNMVLVPPYLIRMKMV